MDTLIVYPKNKEQLSALKAIMKAMEIAFEEKGEHYPEWVTNGVIDSLNEAEAGKLNPYTGINDMLNSK